MTLIVRDIKTPITREDTMRKTLLALAALSATAAFAPPPAQAVEYPWCAEYGGALDATNCGFTTREQCLATISGIGGFCRPNLMYRGWERTSEPRRKRRHRHERQ